MQNIQQYKNGYDWTEKLLKNTSRFQMVTDSSACLLEAEVHKLIVCTSQLLKIFKQASNV